MEKEKIQINKKLTELFPYYSDTLLKKINLSDSDLNVLINAFKQFDADGSGAISEVELGKILK